MNLQHDIFLKSRVQEQIRIGNIYQIKIGKDQFVCKISILNTDGCLDLESFLPFSSLGLE